MDIVSVAESAVFAASSVPARGPQAADAIVVMTTSTVSLGMNASSERIRKRREYSWWRVEKAVGLIMAFRVRVVSRAGGALLAVCLGTLPFSWSTQAAPQTTSLPATVEQKALFDRYCLTCHTQRLKERGTVPI